MLTAYCAVFWMLPFMGIAAGEQRLSLRTDRPIKAFAALPHYQFIAGKESIYRVSYSGTAETDFGVLFKDEGKSADKSQSEPLGLAQSLKTSVQGQLAVTTLDCRDHKVVLVYSLRKAVVKLIANGQDDGTDAEIIRNDLSRDIFAVLDLKGKV